jgi:glycosyltransferase involved in cell wall biosynthesis
VHPSTKEGGGSITLFEANGCGLPVIAYTCKHGIDPKLIIEGQNGFWVDVVSPEALATKMSDVLSLPKKNLKTQAEQFAAEVDWGTIARHYNELYNA